MEANPEDSGKTKREEAARKQTESIFEFLKNKYNTNRLFYFLTDTDRQKISFFMTLHKAIRKRRFRRKKAGAPPCSKGFRETFPKVTGRFIGNVPSLSSKRRDILLLESGHFCGNVPCPHPFQRASERGYALYLLRNGFYIQGKFHRVRSEKTGVM